MPATLRPAGLRLPDLAEVRWTSITKVLREPESNWPAQLLQRPIVAGAVGGRAIALVADPHAARAILTAPSARFVRWKIYNRVLAAHTGQHNIIASDETVSQRQRETFAPMFRAELTPELSPLFGAVAARRTTQWRAGGGPVRIDAGLEMTGVTLEVIWRAMFDPPLGEAAAPEVAAAARRSYAAQREDRINEAGACLAELAPAPGAHSDGRPAPFAALDRLAGTASADALSAQEIYDNARLFLNVGHETTALAMAWALWLIGQDPQTQQRLHAEIDSVVGAGPVCASHLGGLRHLGWVINESLRLFPPVPIIARQALAEETLCGESLPAGAIWAVCIYAMHRHADLWSEPELFRPDRFARGSGQPRQRAGFLPFGAGRHGCLGSALGWTEAMTVLAVILQAFEVETDVSVAVRPRMTVTLRPDPEAAMTLRPRG